MATNQFKEIHFENKLGENLCFCNAGTNALLSSANITSRIRQDHCFCCDLLCGMKDSDPTPIKSTRPLKVFVAQLKPSFRTNRQQDADEFVQCLFISVSWFRFASVFCALGSSSGCTLVRRIKLMVLMLIRVSRIVRLPPSLNRPRIISCCSIY